MTAFDEVFTNTKMPMSKFYWFTHFFNATVLVRFAISKLFAWPISVAAFIEMAQPIGIDPTFFRIFTGITLTVVIIGYSASLVLLAKNGLPKTKNSRGFVQLCNFAGISVMSGALLSEFFLRTDPKWPLVGIACVVIAFSALNLFRLRAAHAAPTQPSFAT